MFLERFVGSNAVGFGIVVLFEMFRNVSAVATMKSNLEDPAEQGAKDAV